MSGDDYNGYGSDKLKDEQNVSYDADFNSAYGSDIDESLPAYESPEGLQTTTVLVAWTSVPRNLSSTDNLDDCVVRMSSLYFCDLY